MEQLQLFKPGSESTTQILVTNFDPSTEKASLQILAQLRENRLSAEIYPDAGKLKKQLNYANKKEIPWVVIVGPDELESGQLTIKNMSTGEQVSQTLDGFIKTAKP